MNTLEGPAPELPPELLLETRYIANINGNQVSVAPVVVSIHTALAIVDAALTQASS